MSSNVRYRGTKINKLIKHGPIYKDRQLERPTGNLVILIDHEIALVGTWESQWGHKGGTCSAWGPGKPSMESGLGVET